MTTSPKPSKTTASTEALGGIRGSLAKSYEELLAKLASGEDGMALGRRHSAVLDAMMRELYEGASAKTGVSNVGLAAVGSWGRGAVALKSDADVRILAPPRSDGRQTALFVEALLYPLWDAGVSLGHQVIEDDDVLQLAQEDLATATALLASRRSSSARGAGCSPTARSEASSTGWRRRRARATSASVARCTCSSRT